MHDGGKKIYWCMPVPPSKSLTLIRNGSGGGGGARDGERKPNTLERCPFGLLGTPQPERKGEGGGKRYSTLNFWGVERNVPHE